MTGLLIEDEMLVIKHTDNVHVADTYSQRVLESCGGRPTAKMIPLNASADGNCLFNAASVAVQGNESLATELRVRTCVELLKNTEHYEKHSKMHRFELVSPDITDICKAAACDKSFSSILTMHALATVLEREIVSVYPAMNGMEDNCIPILNTILSPRHVAKKKLQETIYIMWTRLSGPAPQQHKLTWLPNHFVPLTKSTGSASYDLESEEWPLLPVLTTSSIKGLSPIFSKPAMNVSKHDASSSWNAGLSPSPPPVFSKPAVNVSKHDASSSWNAGLSKPPIVSESTVNVSKYESSSPKNAESSPPPIFSESAVNISEHDSPSPRNAVTHLTSAISSDGSLNGRFLDVDELCEILKTTTPTISEVPRGIKVNVYFVMRNTKNVERRAQGKRCHFNDDCGVWNSKSTSSKASIFQCQDGKIKRAVEIKNNFYSIRVKGVWQATEPQPQESEILIIRRTYMTLKRNSEYKKRVSRIEKIPHGFEKNYRDIVLIEYIGTYPQETSTHGNSKKGCGNEYVRSKAVTMEKNSENIITENPREVYTKLVLENSMDAPRNLKQVQNVKQTISQQNRTTAGNRRNIADDIQTVMTMINNHEFIQEIIQMKGKPPMIILYIDQQITDVKKFCSSDNAASVLGVDRTFNVGACYLTLTVFKNTNLLRISSQDNPIMMGPLYLHWDGECSTYQRFFSHIRTKLDDDINTEIGFGELVIGTDEEKALLKAIKQCFPSATQLLCYRHLEENVRRHLTHKIGINDKIKKQIITAIFGQKGLMQTDDSYEFEKRVLELRGELLEMAPNFIDYFNNLTPRLKKYVFEPTREKKAVCINWTNNNCESLNNIIKLSTKWKILKIPDLIEQLYQIVRLQYADMCRAIHGQGNYEIVKKLRSSVVPHVAWTQKSESEKDLLTKRFFNAKIRSRTKFQKSTDGALEIPKTAAIAKKPGQKKRSRSVRTVGPNKKQQILN